MKIDFKPSAPDASCELVFVNDILEGEFYFDVAREAYLFVPAMGDHLLLPRVNDQEARQLLINKLSRRYNVQPEESLR